MKKFIVMLIGLLTAVLLVGGCGADTEGCLDDFFNEYYTECVQLCDACSTWTNICNIEGDDTNTCINKQWYNDTRNRDCNFYATEVNKWIETKECNPEDSWCLLDLDIN